MKLKLLALAGIMAASMGLTACDSNKENAQEDVVDAQEDVVDAQDDVVDAQADVVEAQNEAALADDTQTTTVTTTDVNAEVPMDGAAVDGTDMDMATNTDAANAADDVVVVEEPAQ
ncbi:hypothetical protein ES754_10955 [Psychrobacter frigidicola]|uniref:Lipoprotein n=1 Tax=Psychrobacter frigidicola TaxID=45611 RepID=A0A5C6ZZ86_9GAMM|nr:hypothetical protein [Psychrobacter frigidicola]TXD96148.1 hypothetical protein ES754_10955 [Psychrobacter frigidicola]